MAVNDRWPREYTPAEQALTPDEATLLMTLFAVARAIAAEDDGESYPPNRTGSR